MICYLCTYPRSGNSLVQSILIGNFNRLVSRIQGHLGSAPGARDPQWEAREAPQPVPDWPEQVLWNDSTAIYRKRGGQWRRTIKPGPDELLTPDVRQALAAERDIVFLKTHGDPFERYFEGERVIQIVRHPGPTLWSLFRYLNDTRVGGDASSLFTTPPLTLETVIEGHPDTGDWTGYHERWAAAAQTLGPRYLRLAYREAAARPLTAAAAISSFLGLPIESDEETGFESYRRRWPSWDLRGSNDGYERYFTSRQLQLMWDRHGGMAESLGCAPPDLERAGPDEQIRRLTELIAAAWRRGYEIELERWRASKRLRNLREAAGDVEPG